MIQGNFQRFTLPIKKIDTPNELTVIILGADVSPRKKAHGPKSLVALGTKWNVIETQLDSIKTVFPKADVILVTGFQSQNIVNKNYQIRLINNPFYEDTSDVEQIRLALNATLSNKVLIIGGDIAFDAPAIMKIADYNSSILFDEINQVDDESVGVIHNNNVVESLSYSLPKKWLYTLYLEGKELEIMRKFVKNKELSKLLFFEAVNYIISAGGLIRAIPQRNGSMYKIGSAK